MATIYKHLNSLLEHRSPNFPSFQQQTFNSRQDDSPPDLTTPLVIGASLAGFFLSTLLLSRSEPKPKLENHPMCGITTGGSDECYFDCDVNSAQLVTNPACLMDCGPAQTTRRRQKAEQCISVFLKDILSNGVCGFSFDLNADGSSIFEGIMIDPNDRCKQSADLSITEGTCLPKTERLLKQASCQQAIYEQPGFIQRTLTRLISDSCTKDVTDSFIEIQLLFSGSRLAPAQAVAESENISVRTILNYANTKHRYPWVCSLRSVGRSPEHLCAVTLLAVPPGPTVVVGAAHCTYTCKNEEGNHVPSCCCNDGTQEDCSENTLQCGEDPKVFDLTEEDAQILCGEWETGDTPSDLSQEKYNEVLAITKIIRHPNWKTKGDSAGPIGGSDLAVFKVNDSAISNNKANSLRLYPACLPERNTGSTRKKTGIHTGWSKPPPFHFVQQRVPKYVRNYRDFFKQWHYKMEIQDKCQDPQNDAVYGIPLKKPSNSSYPAATICAKDFSRQSCFSTGDSGSPLMVREKTRPMRYSVEGILSFVKGCDVFAFGPLSPDLDILNQQTENPSTYTKLSCFLPWIAQQYDLEYEQSDPADPVCYEGEGDPMDGENNKCRTTPSSLEIVLEGVSEAKCIFPFYYRDKLYTECTLFEEDGFVFPVFRCPLRNITTKINEINSFGQIGLTEGICPSNINVPLSPLDPNVQNCGASRFLPFSQCKNNCPGVRAFGVIGGGAVLAAATGLSLLGSLAPVAGVGALGAVGVGGAMMMCSLPGQCRAVSGQCCPLGFVTNGGLECPLQC